MHLDVLFSLVLPNYIDSCHSADNNGEVNKRELFQLPYNSSQTHFQVQGQAGLKYEHTPITILFVGCIYIERGKKKMRTLKHKQSFT